MQTTDIFHQPILHVEHQHVMPQRCEETPSSMAFYYECGLEVEGLLTQSGDVKEWHWTLRNTSAQPSPVVTKCCPLSLELPCRGNRAPVLHGSCGGLDEANFPPLTWAQWSKTIASEGLPHPGVTASSAHGRSSNKDLPFFILENWQRSGGVFIGIGWSGDWNLSMHRERETVRIEAGMTHLHLVLQPGEEFSQPTILLGEYAGDAANGQRALRTYLRDEVQPKLSGQPMMPVSFWDNYYGDFGQMDAADALAEMALASAAGFEYFVCDGGWNGNNPDFRGWSLVPTIGTWRPCPLKYPNGWAPIAAAARQHNLKLGIWFDIEHAHPNSDAMQQRPELFFPTTDSFGCHILRLDTEDGLQWALETMSQVVEAQEIRWARLDFNADPAASWAENDAPDRRGATEIRYIENLYRLWDALLQRFPDLALENCATGGRRIDLETTRRSHTDWISDHSQSEAIMRFHLHGAARWLPSNHLNTTFAHVFLEPHRPADWTNPLPAAAHLSHFGGNFGFSDRLKPLTESGLQGLQKYLQLFERTAPCFAGDIFPLGNQNDLLDGPAGLAGIETATGRKAVVLFGVSPERACDFVPQPFVSLVKNPPLAGDNGDEQFVAAYLWADETGSTRSF